MLDLIGLTLATAVLSGCAWQSVSPHPHYVLGEPWHAGPVWHYPAEDYTLDETGLAGVIANHPASLTTDGEPFDQSAMAAAHPTLQLPAIARVTNLENGRSVKVRINDRGSGSPHYLVEVTRRVADLLGIGPHQAGRVRVQVLSGPSHAVADTLPDAPRLAIRAVPRGNVEVAELPSASSDAHGAGGYPLPDTRAPGGGLPVEPVLERLPETVTQGRPDPGHLWVRLGSFEEYQYAAILRARLSALHPRITQLTQDNSPQFRVEIGPMDDVPRAESLLDQALRAGVPDARIVVE